MLTKEYIQSLNDIPLMQEVLIPLFRAMGFRDVTFYHGGVAEQGKDIVFWHSNELGVRRNMGVVVKAVQINAQANIRNGTMGEVLTQIQQCFGSPFVDPITGQAQDVHECWVISSQRIQKEAISSILSAFASHL